MDDTKEPDKRDAKGRLLPGNSGGPGRRRKQMTEDTENYLNDAWNMKGAKVLVAALDATKLCGADAIEHPDWNVRRQAAIDLRDTLFGKPAQVVTDAEGNSVPLGIVVLPPES